MTTEKRRDKKGRILQKGESQLPDGRYMYRYTDIYGKRKKIYSWKLVPTDMTPVGTREKNSLRELIKELTSDRVKGIDSFLSNNTTLNARWELYLEELAIRNTTRENYIYVWDRYIRDTLGRMKLSDINSSIITNRYLELYNDNCLSFSSIEKIHNLLNPVFDVCVYDNLINTNPATRAMQKIRNIERRKVVGENEDSATSTERAILTPEQETAFLGFLNNDKRCEKWKNLFIVLLRTGARISEICGLTKKDIDLKNDIIHIRRNLLYRKINGKCLRFVSPTKTNRTK